MKRLLTIFILSVFIYNSIGFIVLQPLFTFYTKHLGLRDVENPTKQNLIELIVLKKADILSGNLNFKRIDQKEFRLNNNLFDIVKEVENDSNIIFYCINDKREEALDKNFQKKMEDNAANKQRQANVRVAIKKVISEPIDFLSVNKQNLRGMKHKIIVDAVPDQICRDVSTPPPKYSFI